MSLTGRKINNKHLPLCSLEVEANCGRIIRGGGKEFMTLKQSHESSPKTETKPCGTACFDISITEEGTCLVYSKKLLI